jgi:SPP1 family predicted phage head-tail adaptor
MRAGELRHRVELQRATITRDPMGGEVKTWAQLGIHWASVEPLTGQETFAAQQEGAKVDVRIRLRYEPGIVPTLRVRHGARIYDVTAVLDLEGRHRELHLMATEAVA